MTVISDAVLRLVRGGYDFSDRQKAVLYATLTGAQTVRGMADYLNISKPAISRAVDRLAEDKLVVRKDDPNDRRSVLVSITAKGKTLLKLVEGDS